MVGHVRRQPALLACKKIYSAIALTWPLTTPRLSAAGRGADPDASEGSRSRSHRGRTEEG
eukprot:8035508-Pyramimonas_sp.AAC.1